MRRTSGLLLSLACAGFLVSPVFAAAPATPAPAGAANGAAAAPAPAGEMVENPSYKAWASHKVGTTVVTKRTMDFGGNANESTTTQKLTAVTPEKVTIETTTEGGFGGGGEPVPSDIPAKVAKGQENVMQMGFGGGRGGRGGRGGAGAPPAPTIKDMKEGTDKINVAGKEMNAITHEYTTEMGGRGGAPGTPFKIKTWSVAEVPGGIVKSDMTGDGQQGSFSIKSEVTKFNEGTGAATSAPAK